MGAINTRGTRAHAQGRPVKFYWVNKRLLGGWDSGASSSVFPPGVSMGAKSAGLPTLELNENPRGQFFSPPPRHFMLSAPFAFCYSSYGKLETKHQLPDLHWLRWCKAHEMALMSTPRSMLYHCTCIGDSSLRQRGSMLLSVRSGAFDAVKTRGTGY